ncbi:hypothetical protein BHE74_00007260 [Ensete ventricosum]|nr:hypothetical protein BHE74_00007260 [Ensete ventricosum]
MGGGGGEEGGGGPLVLGSRLDGGRKTIATANAPLFASGSFSREESDGGDIPHCSQIVSGFGFTASAGMGSYSFEEEEYASDQPSDNRVGGSYSPSADVSGSECSSEISGGGFPAASASAPSAGASLLPGGDVPFWEAKLEKRATDVSATVFGELWRLEPLAPQKQTMWRREMEWLLSVSDFIVELVPSIQEFPRCGTFEVMVSRPRADLHINLPALKRLDAMLLLGILEGFRDTEFWYVDRGIMVADADEYGSGSYPPSSSGRPSLRQEEKWWLPVPRVPPNGLSKEARKRLQQSRDCANQILKAAMAINILHNSFYNFDELQSGKSCLGDIIHRYIIADQFSPECLLDLLDLSSEHHILEIANRIEAALYVWRLKGQGRHSPLKAKKNSWSGKVKGIVTDKERSLLLAQRAEGLLRSLRIRYPGLPQTDLDMNKILYNKVILKILFVANILPL